MGRRGGLIRRLAIGVAALLGLWILGSAIFLWRHPSVLGALGWLPPVVDTQPPALPADLSQGELAVLQFSKTSGFRHEDAIPAAAAALERIAARRGWRVFATENAAVFNDDQLRRFGVVFANNTTGDNWTDDQKAAFVRYMEGGGGFVGVHGAGGTRYRYWDWYTDALLRGRFIGHPNAPQIQETTVFVEDRLHPATRHLPAEWVRTDEWYSFEQSARSPGVRVLATLDESRYSLVAGFGPDLAMGDDHPIVWSHCLFGAGDGHEGGGGRAFYSAIGHAAESYADEAHDRMLEGAVAWAAGLKGDC